MSGAAPTPPLTLEWLPGNYAVCRLDPNEPLPNWAQVGAAPRTEAPLLSITRTECELSIVIDQSLIPQDADSRIERDFVALRVVGVLDFSLVGILARLTGALAAVNVPVFVISTVDTDVILVRRIDHQRATGALGAVAALTTL